MKSTRIVGAVIAMYHRSHGVVASVPAPSVCATASA
jgi:hypothetical protein